jgi:hypothetical protein
MGNDPVADLLHLTVVVSTVALAYVDRLTLPAGEHASTQLSAMGRVYRSAAGRSLCDAAGWRRADQSSA